jgi:hypothetical protein
VGVRLALFALLVSLSPWACAPGDGLRVQVINLERPDESLGLPPPPDYTPCYYGEIRAYDSNGDGRPDHVRVSLQGRDRCYGEDTDHNGKIDTWDLVDERGRLIKRAHDANGDGRVDQHWTFDPTRPGCATIFAADGEGKPDPASAVDICEQLSHKASRAAPAP